MESIDRGQVAELMAKANAVGFGPTQVALLEEAVRLADLLGDVRLGCDARTKLILAAEFSGSPEKVLVAFSWCLAQHERDPSTYPLRTLLWQYKYILSTLPRFTAVTRAQVIAALADYARRLGRSGLGMRPLHKLQYKIARNMGDAEEACAAHALWMQSPRGGVSDCPACDLDDEVEHLIAAGRDEEALSHAGPILSGRLKCAEIPHLTLAALLLPLLRMGRVAEALPLQRQGYRLIARSRSLLHSAAEHLRFLALTDDLAKGVKLFEAHFPWALETFNLRVRFEFALASILLFARLKTSGNSAMKLRLPPSFPAFEESGSYDVVGLAAWLDSDAADLARRFDGRNGNDSFARRIEANLALLGLATPSPAKPPGRDQ